MCELLLVVIRGTADKQGNCRASAPCGVLMKRTKVAGPLERQGDQFIPLAHEAGNITGAPALDFLNPLAAAAVIGA